MATFDYAEIEEVAQELLDEFGFAAKLRRFTETGSEREPVNSTYTEQDIQIVDIEEWTRPSDGNMVPVAFKRLLISTKGLTGSVETRDVVVLLNEDGTEGKTHQIEDVLRVAPGARVVLWEARLVN